MHRDGGFRGVAVVPASNAIRVADITHPFWQTDTAMARNTWIHVPDAVYKDAAVMIGDLVDIVSKNGALLLNIGPRPDGSIPEAELDVAPQQVVQCQAETAVGGFEPIPP